MLGCLITAESSKCKVYRFAKEDTLSQFHLIGKESVLRYLIAQGIGYPVSWASVSQQPELMQLRELSGGENNKRGPLNYFS